MEKEVRCPSCGEPLQKAFELSEQEKQDLRSLNAREDDLKNQLNTVSIMEIDRGLKKVINKIFLKKADVFIKEQELLNKLSKKYNCYVNYQIIDGVAYIHN